MTWTVMFQRSPLLKWQLFATAIAAAAVLLGCRPSDTDSSSSDRQQKVPKSAVFSQNSSEEQNAESLQSIGRTDEVAVTVNGEPLRWNTLKMEGGRPTFHAVHFTSPLKSKAEMRLIFVLSEKKSDENTQWNIVPTKGVVSPGFESYCYEEDLYLDAEGHETGIRNRVFLQSLNGGQIEAGQSYVLWFRDYDFAKKISLAVRLLPTGTLPASSTSDEIARDLGLAVPLRHNDLKRWNELDTQLRDGFRLRNAALALRAAEEQIEKYPLTRQGLFIAANLSISRGEQIRDRGESLDPNPFFFNAATYMRRLQVRFGKLTDQERPGLAEAIYFEAEAFASQGDKQRALTSLEAALAAGYGSPHVDLPRFQAVASNDELSSVMAKFPVASPTSTGQPL